MQEYFERKVFPDVPDVQMQLSFAGTLMELFVDLMGPVFQILSARFGIRFVLVLGSIIMVAGLELASLSTEVSNVAYRYHACINHYCFGRYIMSI